MAGFRGCRVERVAARARVSVGTIYRYATGKEAHFELVVQRAFGDFDEALIAVPFRGTGSLDFVDELWRRLRGTDPVQAVREAVARDAPEDPAAELEAIVRELYRWQSRHWRTLLLIERCACEWPELDMLFLRDAPPHRAGLGRNG